MREVQWCESDMFLVQRQVKLNPFNRQRQIMFTGHQLAALWQNDGPSQKFLS